MDASRAINVRDHCTVIDSSRSRVQCNYCGKVVSGLTRLKCHVGGIRGDVVPCLKAPADVKELLRNLFLERKRESFGKEVEELYHPDLPWKRSFGPSSNSIKHNKCGYSQTAGSQNGSQEEIDSVLENSAQREGDKETKADLMLRQAQKCIGRFFYETDLEFTAANSSSLKRMINSILGPGHMDYKIPSCEELKGWILQDEVKEIQEYVQKIKNSWASTGCSILLDGWIDIKGRNLINILVNCPQGPIYLCSHDISSFVDDIDAMYSLLEEIMKDVGVENVVQVVADSTTGWAGAVGKEFINRCKGVFWTVSASHCIELMLEKIGMIGSNREILDKAKTITKFIHGHATVLELLKKHTVGRDLIKPSKIRSAMPFMTLENIVSEKQKLKNMFSSSQWNMSVWASRVEGKRVVDLVADHSFWTGAQMVLKASMPLVRVLNLIFEADKPLVGYIYETMDQVKETIKEELKSSKSQYMPIWKAIDEIWDNHLHSPLHGAGYYLNPSLFYSSDFYGDDEVAFGLLCCIVQMVQNQPSQDLISRQFEEYRHARGSFKEGSSIGRRKNIPPDTWWSCYGKQFPELQRFAIRILSQNCDGASKYGLKRTLAEKLLTNGRNPIEQQRLSDLAFVHYNLQLQQFCSGVKSGIVTEDTDPLDDWIIDEAPDIVSRNAIGEEGPSRFEGKTDEPM